MNEYLIVLKGGRETVIRAKSCDREAGWFIFRDDESNEVQRFAVDSVESCGLLSARRGPAIA